MTRIFTLFLTTLCALQLSAQITIERSEYFYEYGDSTFLLALAQPGTVPFPEGGEDMVWDYSNLQFPATINRFFDHENPYSDTLVPYANGSSTSLVEIDLFPGAVQTTTFFTVLNDDGYYTTARLAARTAFPLQGITGVATDSLLYLENLVEYGDARAGVVAFPITYGDTVAQYRLDLPQDIVLTATPLGINQVPGQIVGIRYDTTVINGWGDLQITDPLSGNLISIPSLLYNRRSTVIDSFFLGGAPASQDLLDAFGQTQGSVRTANDNKFYAEGFSNYVMRIRRNEDNEFEVEINADLLGFVSSLYAPREDLLDISTYPNPASGEFSLRFDKTSNAHWTFVLLNMQGRTVHRQQLTHGTGKQNYTVRPPVPARGAHAYVIRDEHGQVVGSGKVMLQ